MTLTVLQVCGEKHGFFEFNYCKQCDKRICDGCTQKCGSWSVECDHKVCPTCYDTYSTYKYLDTTRRICDTCVKTIHTCYGCNAIFFHENSASITRASCQHIYCEECHGEHKMHTYAEGGSQRLICHVCIRVKFRCFE